MEPIAAPIMDILGNYTLDMGRQLGKEVGPQAMETAGELFTSVMSRLREDPDGQFIADRFEQAPEIYQKPLEAELDRAVRADPGFAAQLQSLLERYQEAAGAHAAGPRTATVEDDGVAVVADVRGDLEVSSVRTGGGAYFGGSLKVDTGGGTFVGKPVNTGGGDFVGREQSGTGGGAYVAAPVHTGGGDFVGRDQVKTVGLTAEDVAKLFGPIYGAIEARPDTPTEERADMKAEVEEIQAEVAKGDEADESFLSRRLRNLKRMAPDILEVVLGTLANPAAGLGLVASKVAKKMQAEA